MSLSSLFHRKKKNEFEQNPTKYIEAAFKFLEEQGFQKTFLSVNCENAVSYEKDDFHVSITYFTDMKMKYGVSIAVYYKRWDRDSLTEHLFIKNEQYKSRFEDYDNIDCKEKIDLVAEYLSQYIEEVISANKSKYGRWY